MELTDRWLFLRWSASRPAVTRRAMASSQVVMLDSARKPGKARMTRAHVSWQASSAISRLPLRWYAKRQTLGWRRLASSWRAHLSPSLADAASRSSTGTSACSAGPAARSPSCAGARSSSGVDPSVCPVERAWRAAAQCGESAVCRLVSMRSFL